jgi:osmotically-inducible protein OsmY
MDQGNTEEDIRISSSIRKSIVNDKSLSTNAHNIKIITETGNVTLRGPVKSSHESSKIEAYAKMATGVGRVDNMLEVEKNP